MNNLHITRDVWTRFVQEGVLDRDRVSKRIIESWYRCKEYDVDPYLDRGRFILLEEEYEQKLASNMELIQCSMPYLQSICKLTKHSPAVIVLTDAEGYVLRLLGDKSLLNYLKKINLVAGVKWAEKEVGTNAIGTALAIGESIKVTGKEHYSQASHNYSCYAAPIKNIRGELLGVLDITIENRHAEDVNLLCLAVTNAYAIEAELRLQAQRRRTALLEKFLEKERKIGTDLIISDRDGYFVTATSTILQLIKHDSHFYDSPVQDLEKIGIQFLRKSPIYCHKYQLLGYSHEVAFMEKNACLPTSVPHPFIFAGERGVSTKFTKLLQDLELVAKSDATVAIYGESGTGKEVVARSIHLNSKRRKEPFVAVNCGALPKHLLESELFGYTEGAFTGARKKGYDGKFVQANGGTLFLDEIGDMPFSMQVSLLRVLQEKEVTPIGGSKPIPIDVRIVTATHQNLKELVRQGKFREDLFFRLHVFDIDVPPLRERKKDIPHLVNYFFHKKNIDIKIPNAVQECFLQYDWPGNIRELYNVLEKMLVLADGHALKERHIPHYIKGASSKDLKNQYETTYLLTPTDQCSTAPKRTDLTGKERVQKEKMLKALQLTNGNVREAADSIEMPLSTFYRKMKKFNLS